MTQRESRTSSDSGSYLPRGDDFSTRRGPGIRTGAGFTIIELLIVVVVIAILATITVVAYNGITKKAQTTAYLAAADSVEKQVRVAISLGQRPNGAVTFACLGAEQDYPASGPFASGECQIQKDSSGAVTLRRAVNETQMSWLTEGVSSFQIPKGLATATVPYGDGTLTSRGMVLTWLPIPEDQGGGNFIILLQWNTPSPGGCGRGLDTGYGQLADLIGQYLSILYRARDGAITPAQADLELETLAGEPQEPLTHELILEIIPIYEQMLSNANTSICMMQI